MWYKISVKVIKEPRAISTIQHDKHARAGQNPQHFTYKIAIKECITIV